MPIPMVLDLPSLHAHLHKPFAVKLDELLSRIMLFGKWYISMSAEDQHGRSAGQAIADDYDVIRIAQQCQWLQFAEFAILFHGAMSTGFLFTYNLR